MDELYTAITFYDEEKFMEAYELFYPLATSKKNPEAQFYLGMMYFYGEGLTADLMSVKATIEKQKNELKAMLKDNEMGVTDKEKKLLKWKVKNIIKK